MDVKGFSTASLFETHRLEQTINAVIIPVPWNVTDATGSTTSQAPACIVRCSQEPVQQDHSTPTRLDQVSLQPTDQDWQERNDRLRPQVLSYMDVAQTTSTPTKSHLPLIQEVNRSIKELRSEIDRNACMLIGAGKMVGVLGGDRSTPLGLLDALSKFYSNFGVLHISARSRMDAPSVQNFACVPTNFTNYLLNMPFISRITQVGIRACTAYENEAIRAHQGRLNSFGEAPLQSRLQTGVP